MSIEEYAKDVNRAIEEIKKLCNKLNISTTNSLSEEDIIILDNELQDEVDYVEEEEDLDDKVDKIIENSKFKVDDTIKIEKLKSKSEIISEGNEFLKSKKEIYKKREKLMTNDTVINKDVVYYHNNMNVADLAKILKVNAIEVIKKLMNLGIMSNINTALSFENCELVLLDYDKTLKQEEAADISNFEQYEIIDSEENLEKRPPIVTIMGHVDHGKTSLLDAIRETDVVASEKGGITQATDAYQVKCNNELITFIDTPGHAAFTAMRARGASVTDIVIIIVAADDGVMPQTIEAIDHAKAAGVPIIVAINKIDKPNTNIERIMTQISEAGLTPEEWGGDTIVCQVSAKTKEGIPNLLETILLIAQMKELKANSNRYAAGTVIEAKLDRQRGVIANVLIQNGTLRLSDPIVVGTSFGKVRTLRNDKGFDIVEALPSSPVEITGLTILPSAGDKFMAFETEKQAKEVAMSRKIRVKEADNNRSSMTLEELFAEKTDIKLLNIILKADVNGSLEAIKDALLKLEIENSKVKIIRGAVGEITESDVILAKASNALIYGFNVGVNYQVVEYAKENEVILKTYDIIYKIIEEVEVLLHGNKVLEYVDKPLGKAEIRHIFTFSKVGNIAGCNVTTGLIKAHSLIRVLRKEEIIFEGKIKTLQREKDTVKEVTKGMDCGITIEDFDDIKELDIIEAYEKVIKK